MTTGKLNSEPAHKERRSRRSGKQRAGLQTGCLGSHRVERSYQPRLITRWIVPDYLVQLSK